jgi:membrane protein implicated in regulation of membrane protease activity
MNYLFLIIAGIAIASGIFIGALIVWFIYFWRRRQIVDSSIKAEDFIGIYGTVEIPFDANSKGKVRVNLKGSMLDVVALTEESRQFNFGDRVLIIQTQGNKVWVIGEDSVNSD